MTDTGRSKANRRTKRGANHTLLAGLVLLGVISSILLILSDSVPLLRVGIVAALWAAILGAFAMTKYRRDAVADQVKARDLQTVYELQLEREIAARREYELGVESRVRSEIGADAGEMRALRSELASLRRSLEMLFDGDLPDDRAAIAGEAQRMRELAERSYSGYEPAASGLYVPGARGRPTYAPDPAFGRPGFATPFDEPVTAETSVIGGEFDHDGNFYPTPDSHPTPEWTPSTHRSDDSDAPSEADGGMRQEQPESEPEFVPEFVPRGNFGRPRPAPEVEEARVAEVPVDEVPVDEVPVDEVPVDEVPVEEPPVDEPPVDQPPVEQAPVEQAPVEDPPIPAWEGRRRRYSEDQSDADAGSITNGSGAHSSGRSVADILAGMESADASPAPGRRRRRAE